ncbi:hypothetical protein M2360_004884 [Rhizobium sp. SG_E_25_P2]|uniref:DUF6626 family protein n=1 Tax=Rhizobium sp. SG_E_25_P2 TaxID=2879942 RepID=UPI0024769749|nr:DUF6626 family protein [Rhizobium sp. SG_E_25_P2]MDH6269456.1 hypothetical protein [Rhizobium sp. SG_E_25_P2]
MNVSEIYQSMRSLGLASSQVQFSTVWLGRSPRYYSQLVATDREPSVGALLGLSVRLDRIARSMKPDAASAVRDLVSSLGDCYERREMVAVRRRKRYDVSHPDH